MTNALEMPMREAAAAAPVCERTAETQMSRMRRGRDPGARPQKKGEKIGQARIRMSHVIEAAALHCKVSEGAICGHCHLAAFVYPRMLAYYVGVNHLNRSTLHVARYIGDRDHTTILHGIRKIAGLIPQRPKVADDIEAVWKIARDLCVEEAKRFGVKV